ncbi:unnamed protein product [marine sediment metagenome]|uniref:Uncharacterized protein n=1 Tax=marine sediment metagenome TaxID=412755 RepID=X1S039_9ZZZZ
MPILKSIFFVTGEKEKDVFLQNLNQNELNNVKGIIIRSVILADR